MEDNRKDTPPKTLGEALDELAAAGLADEVAAVRQRMHVAQTQHFIALLDDPDEIPG